MTRLRGLKAGIGAVALFAAAPALAASSSVTVVARAKVVKPLTISWVQDLDLGTIILGGNSAWSGATVGISRSGALSCTSGNIACTGFRQVAKYRVNGTNNQTVTISAPNVTLVNQSDAGKTLSMTVDSPGSLLLTNSGPQGVVFALGGSITLSSTTADGLYVGTFNVTVDY